MLTLSYLVQTSAAPKTCALRACTSCEAVRPRDRLRPHMIRLERLADLRPTPPHCLWTLGAPALDEGIYIGSIQELDVAGAAAIAIY